MDILKLFGNCLAVLIGILIASLWRTRSILNMSSCLDITKLLREKPDISLGICILSAQTHFEHREALRNSWLSDVHTQTKSGTRVVARFAVGQHACHIHPENRIDTHSCEKWEPSMPGNIMEVKAFQSEPGKETSVNKRNIFSEYIYVKAMEDIIVRRIGILKEALPFRHKQNYTLRIGLFDSVTSDELTHATFSPLLGGVDLNGYIYRPVEQVVIPKVGHQNLRAFVSKD